MRKVWFTLMLLLGIAVFSEAAEELPERWVLAKYIKNDQVMTGNPEAVLNIRSGPGLTFDAVGTLKEGQPVKEYARQADWVRISPKVIEQAETADAASGAENDQTMMIRYGIIIAGLLGTLVVLFKKATA